MRPEQIADGLSAVNRQTLDLLLQGMTQREIARRVDASFHTVSNRVRTVQKAFNVKSRAELQALFVVPPHLRPLVGVDGVRVRELHADVVIAKKAKVERADVDHADMKSAWIASMKQPAVAAGAGAIGVTTLLIIALFLQGGEPAAADSVDHAGRLGEPVAVRGATDALAARADVILLPGGHDVTEVAFVEVGQRLVFSGEGSVRVWIGPSFVDLAGDLIYDAPVSGMMRFESLDHRGSSYRIETDSLLVSAAID